MKLNNVASVVYEPPFGRGHRFGWDMNPVLNAIVGGWQLSTINTWHTGTPLNVFYAPSTANDVTGLSSDFRGQAFQRPNVSGTGVDQGSSQMINTFFAGYTFTTPPASAPFGNLGRNAFRAPSFEQWNFAANKTFVFRESLRLQFPLGSFQLSEPHQLRHPEHADHGCCLRDHSHDVSGAADSVRTQADILDFFCALKRRGRAPSAPVFVVPLEFCLFLLNP